MTASGDIAWDSLTSTDKNTLARCAHLAELLSGCLVGKDYKPPVQLCAALRLSSRGARLAGQVKGDGIELREAQLATFMEIVAGDSLLVDVPQMDLAPVEANISSEIRRARIRLPWIYGRGLYDAVADSQLNKQPFPTPEETEGLLEGRLTGVFQHGPYVAGPYGLVEARQWRYIPVRRAIPAYHCEEPDCHQVHAIRLASHRTGVGRAQDAIREKLEKTRRVASRLDEILDPLEIELQPPYRWNNMDTLPFFLADCFSEAERCRVLAHLLDGTKGTLRAACGAITDDDIKSASDWIASKSESEVMQIILLATDDEIHIALNQLIWAGTLEIPRGETRSAKLLSGGAGPLRVDLQASHLGVRFKTPSTFLQLRLREIITSVYATSDADRQGRLGWLLRKYDGETGLDRLTHALAADDPRQIVERLLVADERAYRESMARLGLNSDRFVHESDDVLAELISWHLGLNVEAPPAELRYLRTQAQELRQLVQSLPIDVLSKHQMGDVQGLGGKLFPALEAILKRTLRFSCWALLRDHFGAGAELAYSARSAEDFFDSWIEPHVGRLERRRAGDMALSDLLTCFGILAKHLRGLATDRIKHERARGDWPRPARDWGSPFSFVFKHTALYLDLDTPSQHRIADSIEKVASGLQTEKVLVVRNSLLHDTDDFPGTDVILRALNEIDARLGQLTSLGLYPIEYRLAGSETDDVGRVRVTLRASEGGDVTLLRPSPLDLSAFPARADVQIVVAGARIVESPEPIRFLSLQDSEFMARWSNFPRRPKRRLSHSSDSSAAR